MDFSEINEQCNAAFMNKAIRVNASTLYINYALYACPYLSYANKFNIQLQIDDLAFLIASDILVGWDDVHDKDGSNVKFSQLNAFNALANDSNFLLQVVELAFDKSKFIG